MRASIMFFSFFLLVAGGLIDPISRGKPYILSATALKLEDLQMMLGQSRRTDGKLFHNKQSSDFWPLLHATLYRGTRSDNVAENVPTYYANLLESLAPSIDNQDDAFKQALLASKSEEMALSGVPGWSNRYLDELNTGRFQPMRGKRS